MKYLCRFTVKDSMANDGTKKCKKCGKSESSESSLTTLTCCLTESSAVEVCKECIVEGFNPESDENSNIFICPNPKCQKMFTVKVSGDLEKFERLGKCGMCCTNQTIVTATNLCDKCLMGQSYEFKYICKRCGKTQKIPHPMWKYAKSARKFGGSWSCHQGCNDYTNWMIHPDYVKDVPVGTFDTLR